MFPSFRPSSGLLTERRTETCCHQNKNKQIYYCIGQQLVSSFLFYNSLKNCFFFSTNTLFILDMTNCSLLCLPDYTASHPWKRQISLFAVGIFQCNKYANALQVLYTWSTKGKPSVISVCLRFCLLLNYWWLKCIGFEAQL